MRNLLLKAIFILFIYSSLQVNAQQTTICNPLNLNYRFQLNNPSRREAADPAVVLFKGKYFLFASKSGGYWVSENLINWTFITTRATLGKASKRPLYAAQKCLKFSSQRTSRLESSHPKPIWIDFGHESTEHPMQYTRIPGGSRHHHLAAMLLILC